MYQLASLEDFPNSSKVRGSRELKVLLGWGLEFFTRWWEPEEERFWRFKPFSKPKTTFCEYWTSIKIKISMACVFKEYEIKTKMVQEQWLQLKVTLYYRVTTWRLLFSGGGEGTDFRIKNPACRNIFQQSLWY